MTIGESIRYHRRRLNLTQAQLGERLGVSAQAVSKWETDTGLPDISMAAPLARALGTTTDELLRFGERYQEFEELWKEQLRRNVNDHRALLEIARRALLEFPYDRTYLFRAAMDAKSLGDDAEGEEQERYYGMAAAYARMELDNDPDKRLAANVYAELTEKLHAIWHEQGKL